MRRNMWKRAGTWLLAVSVTFSGSGITALAQEKSAVQADFETVMEESFQNPEMAHRPYARWWLAEGSHTDKTLKESVRELYDAGYGGIEFVTLDESRYLKDEEYGWGSEEWIHDSQLIIQECHRLGMNVSMTSGTHWTTANLTVINPDMQEASQELGYTVTEPFTGTLKGELKLCDLPENVTKQRLVSVVAAEVADVGEKTTKLDADSMTVLSRDQVTQVKNADGSLHSVSVDFTAPGEGSYLIFAFYQYGTGEYYTPAATGKSYTINYLAKEGANALINYWNENVLTDKLQKVINEIDECDMFMDSLELKTRGTQSTGQLWCTEMLDEFSGRTDYDLEKYLPFLIKTGGGFGSALEYPYEAADTEDITFHDNLRDEFYQVMTELYTENCLQVLSDWLHTKNMKLRAQNSYGQTFDLSWPVQALDYVETESLEFGNEIESYRMMAGAAHVFDKRFSSESGALSNANYMYNNGYFRQLFYMQYASGIQKTIVHGYSSEYGPEERVNWPGYEGMQDVFSERFNKRQPGTVDYTEVNRHLGRIQKVLEQGKPQMDLLILRSDYNVHNWVVAYAGGSDMYQNLTHRHQGLYWKDMELQDAGYTYEYLSPHVLAEDEITCSDKKINPDGAAYQAVIVMQDELPYETACRLLEWAKAGLPVVFVNNTQETMTWTETKMNTLAGSTTGCNDGKDAELAELVKEMKSLNNVMTVDSAKDAYEAMQALGVRPRAEYVESNNKILSSMRKTDEAAYLYLYNYMYQDTANYQGQISVEGNYEPYVLDTWNGDVAQVADFKSEDGRTILNVDLAPGEIMVFILKTAGTAENTVVDSENVYKFFRDGEQILAAVSEGEEATVTFSDGSTANIDADAPKDLTLSGWSLTVDAFDKGEKILRTEANEDTGLTSTEAAYTTKHTNLEVGTLDQLVPWKDIDELGEYVSGVGTYKTTFRLPQNWSKEENGAFFTADSFNYGTAAMWVNGERVYADMDSASADISDYVKAGENTIEVRITSSLRNIMRKVGYLIKEEGSSGGSAGFQHTIGGWTSQPEADSYGMTGETRLITYKKVAVAPEQENLKDRLENAQKELEALKKQAAKEAEKLESVKKEAAANREKVKAAEEAARRAAEEARKAEAKVQRLEFAAKKVTIRKAVSTGKKKAKVTWKKVSGAQGYEIRYAANGRFKKARRVTVGRGTAVGKVFKCLKSKRKYYFRVRAYKTVEGKRVYSRISGKKSVRVK